MTLYEQLEREIRMAHTGLRSTLAERAHAIKMHARRGSIAEIHRRLYFLEGLIAAWAIMQNQVVVTRPFMLDELTADYIEDHLHIDLPALEEEVRQA